MRRVCPLLRARGVASTLPHTRADHADEAAQLESLNDVLELKAQNIEETKLRLKVIGKVFGHDSLRDGRMSGKVHNQDEKQPFTRSTSTCESLSLLRPAFLRSGRIFQGAGHGVCPLDMMMKATHKHLFSDALSTDSRRLLIPRARDALHLGEL